MKSLPKVGVFSIDVLVNTANEKLVFIPGVADLLLSVIRDDMHVAIATNMTALRAEEALVTLDAQFVALGAPSARGVILVICNVHTLNLSNGIQHAMAFANTRSFHDVMVIGQHYKIDLAAADTLGCRLALFANGTTPAHQIQHMTRHPRGFVAYRLEDIYSSLLTPL